MRNLEESDILGGEILSSLTIKYLKTGFWIWLWSFLISFGIGIVIAVISVGLGVLSPDLLVMFLIVWLFISIPLSWVILGWSAHKVLGKRGT